MLSLREGDGFRKGLVPPGKAGSTSERTGGASGHTTSHAVKQNEFNASDNHKLCVCRARSQWQRPYVDAAVCLSGWECIFFGGGGAGCVSTSLQENGSFKGKFAPCSIWSCFLMCAASTTTAYLCVSLSLFLSSLRSPPRLPVSPSFRSEDWLLPCQVGVVKEGNMLTHTHTHIP